MPTKRDAPTAEVKLLAGGNPQIPKGDGDEPVQRYIDAMPGWKHEVGRYLDDLISRTVPEVEKAVRWNSPFYGLEGQGWFLSFHCFDRYVKVTFFKGNALDPMPPVASKHPEPRYLHVHEHDLAHGKVDEPQLERWIEQASRIPGWIP